MASKFFEHFLYIAHAMTTARTATSGSLWDDEDGFYYDVLHMPDGHVTQLKVRSLVGLIPLFAVETLEPDMLDEAAGIQPPPGMVRATIAPISRR